MSDVVASSGARGNVVCDLDGVVYLDGRALPGVGEALEQITARGYRVVFATNNSTKPPEEVALRIRSISGFPAVPEQVVTSGLAAATMLGASDGPVLVVGETGITAAVAGAGLAITAAPGAAATVIVGYTRSFDYRMLTDATRALLRGARFIATNTDATLPTPEGPLPGGGSLVAAIATAAGREPEVAGKPHDPMARAIERLLGPGATWMVGDRPETDLAIAADRGWTGVLVLSGVTRDPAAIPRGSAPDAVIGGLADLPALLP